MLTLNDGRSELWQWDTGRTLSVDADCSQVHFSNKVFGRSIDVDVVDGVAIIPDILLQTDNDLNVWAFVGTAENGYTKISKTFKVNRRNKPADYVFTPTGQTTLSKLVDRIDKIEESQSPEAIKNVIDDYLEQNPVEIPVQSVNGQTGAVELTAEDVGAIADETALTGVELFPAWAVGRAYAVDDRVQYNGALYKCVQAHTSQAYWAPDATPALWVVVSIDEYPEWVQPAGAHDAYHRGDKVSYHGKHYICTADANVYAPDVYGWDVM